MMTFDYLIGFYCPYRQRYIPGNQRERERENWLTVFIVEQFSRNTFWNKEKSRRTPKYRMGQAPRAAYDSLPQKYPNRPTGLFSNAAKHDTVFIVLAVGALLKAEVVFVSADVPIWIKCPGPEALSTIPPFSPPFPISLTSCLFPFPLAFSLTVSPSYSPFVSPFTLVWSPPSLSVSLTVSQFNSILCLPHLVSVSFTLLSLSLSILFTLPPILPHSFCSVFPPLGLFQCLSL